MAENQDDKKKDGKEAGDNGALTDKNESQPGNGGEGEKTGDGLNPVPYERFKQINDEKNALQARIDELEANKAQADSDAERQRQEELKRQEKFEQLATELGSKVEDLEPKLSQAEKTIADYETVLEKLAAVQLEAVPELYRGVVGAMPLVERLNWLAENQDKLTEKQPGGIPKTPDQKGRGEITDEERRKRARKTF